LWESSQRKNGGGGGVICRPQDKTKMVIYGMINCRKPLFKQNYLI